MPKYTGSFTYGSRFEAASIGQPVLMQSRRHPPMLDFAFVTLRRALGLPRGAAFGLFVLGRAVGWIVHALDFGRAKSTTTPEQRWALRPSRSKLMAAGRTCRDATVSAVESSSA
jgi:citrate synthase